jgi:hypothetical protein
VNGIGSAAKIWAFDRFRYPVTGGTVAAVVTAADADQEDPRTRDFRCATSQLKTATPPNLASEAAIVKANVISAIGSPITNRARESVAQRDPHIRRNVRAVAAATIFQDFMGAPPTPPLDALKSKLEAAQSEAEAAERRHAPQPAVAN